MFRKYVIITLAAYMVFGTSACTSKKADDNADVEATAQSGDESLETADASIDNNDLAADKSGASGDLGDGLAPEEKLPDDTGTAQAATSTPTPSDLTETPPADTMASTPPPDAGAPPMADAGAPPPAADMSSPSEPPPADTPPPSMADSSATPEPSSGGGAAQSLKKVNAQPYKQGKTLVNAYYIARKGDTVEGISQKVFGSADHVKALCKVNAYNCGRGIKVGDKFYYNSPQRPTDESTVKNFYEDAGIAPQVYTAKAGDSIRKVGKELLGHERSWMELWATNDVESKGALDEGTALKYWPATESAAPTQTIAKTDAAAPGAEAAPPADQASATPPADAAPSAEGAPPPPDQAAAPPPPPPPSDALPPAPDQAAAGSVEPPPPPPPPPPTDTAGHKEPVDASGATAMQDPNQTMALGVGAILLLAAAALFISIRKKKRARQIDFNTTTQTQIE